MDFRRTEGWGAESHHYGGDCQRRVGLERKEDAGGGGEGRANRMQ